jgi:hypothetical protein
LDLPESCKDEPGISGFANLQTAKSFYETTCVGNVIIDPFPPVDPFPPHPPPVVDDDFGGESSGFDFKHCMSAYDERPSPALPCGVSQTAEMFQALTGFQQCTGWDPAELFVALISGQDDFINLITECGDLDDFDPQGCIQAVHDVANDQDNPMHKYIHDFYDDPRKCCSCNSDFGSSLHSCEFALAGSSIHTAEVILGSCLFDELCDEFQTTCQVLGESIESCIARSGALSATATASSVSCQEDCHEFETPTGCYREIVDFDLQQELEVYHTFSGDSPIVDPPQEGIKVSYNYF